MRFSIALILVVITAGCSATQATLRQSPILDPVPSNVDRDSSATNDCSNCGAGVFDEALIARSTERVAQLKTLGGECATYASVLESSLFSGRVTVRPFMWRVEGRLVSGEARPDGAIVVAREIDPLNVGMRSIDDVVRTLEHEAAHVAFRITNGRDADPASVLVRGCRSGH